MSEAAAAIAVIAKSPVPGRVKTRMQPALDPTESADLAGRLLLDAIDQAAGTGADVWCSYAGPPQPLRALLPANVPLLEQRGAGLAERLRATQSDLFSVGYASVILFGGDCPTVGTAPLRKALATLRRDPSRAVLGPAADGGYTLLATAVPTPHLFDGVQMSTDRVLSDTLDRAVRAGTPVTLLEVRHDLDTANDLVTALRAGQLDAAPRTRAIAERLAAAALPASR
ncbi:MAG: TIGR04282 family arsenosugar biosynthesis glycosyltransferase [Egibacteraceae bacterium]